jgi:hypothetical protein
MRMSIAIFACAILASCASVSKEDCIAGDWVTIGARDGLAGRVGDSQFARHTDACAKVQVTPDRSAWAQGYAQGLAQYCTPQSALREGLAGRTYRGVCPQATQASFQRAYDLGRNVYDQKQVIAQIDSEASTLRSRAAQISGATDPGLVNERVSIDSDLLHLRLMRMSEQAKLARMERDVAAFRAGL